MTSSQPPRGTDGPTARRPDATDPDLAPVPALSDTGHLPAYADDAPPAYAEVATDDVDGDHEAVEDGLQEPRSGPEVAAVRLGRRPRDMFLSLGVLLVVVLGIFGIYQLLGGDDTAVDTSPAITEAQRAGAFPVVAPSGLGSDWTAISAAYQPQDAGAVLRIGYESPSGGELQLIEGSLSPDAMQARELGDNAKATTTAELGGRQWQLYDARQDERAYVFQEAGRTIIVVGRATDAEFKQFIEALK